MTGWRFLATTCYVCVTPRHRGARVAAAAIAHRHGMRPQTQVSGDMNVRVVPIELEGKLEEAAPEDTAAQRAAKRRRLRKSSHGAQFLLAEAGDGTAATPAPKLHDLHGQGPSGAGTRAVRYRAGSDASIPAALRSPRSQVISVAVPFSPDAKPAAGAAPK